MLEEGNVAVENEDGLDLVSTNLFIIRRDFDQTSSDPSEPPSHKDSNKTLPQGSLFRTIPINSILTTQTGGREADRHSRRFSVSLRV
ncbi:hypothetical protein AAMO2058_001472900 [Amorphochlora amoebiformis]